MRLRVLDPRSPFSGVSFSHLTCGASSPSRIWSCHYRRATIFRSVHSVARQYGRTSRDEDLQHYPLTCQASFWRGGTSKGVFINEKDLPVWVFGQVKGHSRQVVPGSWRSGKDLQRLLDAIIGSPDPYGRQLNGLGGGISSLSKVVIYRVPEPSETTDYDIEYTFVQVDIKTGELDMTGNCGNLTSAVGPVAIRSQAYVPSEEDLVKSPRVLRDGQISQQNKDFAYVNLRLKNINTDKIIQARFPLQRGKLLNGTKRVWRYLESGPYSIDGVPGQAAEINLKWMEPGGSKTGRVLPTGNPTDVLDIGSESVKASLVDVSNPGIFVDGRGFNWSFDRTPEDLNQNKELMSRLEALRKKGAELMGLPPTKPSIPKIVLVYPSDSEDAAIQCQAISMEQAHKAVPGTLALNLAAACKLRDTIPYQLRQESGQMRKGQIAIGHPSGKAQIDADVRDGIVVSVGFSRTARSLMEGFVNYASSREVPIPSLGYKTGHMLRRAPDFR